MSRNSIRLEEEIEGDRDGTSDFVFFKIGSSVPLKRGNSSFDLSNPPGRPLAVSEQYGVLFLVGDGGFMVVKTVDAIGVAKGIKEIEKGNRKKADVDDLCIQEKSILDVQIGNVHILAVSTDSSNLAAIVGQVVHFFQVSSLIQKKQETVFSCSIGGSDNIKDFLWQKNKEASFIMLSDSGQLYHGKIKGDLKNIMDSVDAADWSVEGDFLVVARDNVVSILSSEFKEELSMSLSFQSWIGSSDSNVTVKVNTIKWVRSDSIVIGCTQVNEDGEETDYMVQVITTTETGFDEDSSKTMVVSFSDLFRGIVDDIVPSNSRPHLFINYLKDWELAFISNRKNTDEHVVIMAWSGDDVKRPICLEFEQEKFIPRIDLQENGDENLLLGIDVDGVSIYEKLEFIVDSEVKFLSPHCILLCLSCEGKLIMFHVARLSEPACPPEALKPLAEKDLKPLSQEEFSSVSPLRDDQSIPTVVKLEDSATKAIVNITSSGQEQRAFGIATSSSIAPQNTSVSPTRDTEKEQVPKFPAEFETSIQKTQSTVSLIGDGRSEASASKVLSKVFSMNKEVVPTSAPFRLQLTNKPGDSGGITLKYPLLNSSGSTPGDSPGTTGSQRNNIIQGFPSGVQSSLKLSREFGTKATLTPGNIEPSARESVIPEKFAISNRLPGLQESEVKLVKQFYSVDDMTKELDSLLQDIEREGGFMDACTVVQRSSVLSLEEGISKLSEKFRTCKAKVEEQLKEIHRLQDRRMQVTSRQIYMEGLVKQASNGQYWDLWNSQKLGPEFEVKQQRISMLNHMLVNELVELERHFNALELRKYGESGASLKGRRAIGETFSSSRQNYSLHTLHNTVNSQIAAAEQLSDCLSKHMGLLKISSPPVKQYSAKRELLESIGLDYDSESFQSPKQKKSVYSPDSSKKISFLPLSSRETSGEPESSRRRRDSLDRSWTKFDPPKTTVKRMQLEERSRIRTEKTYSPVKEEPGFQFPQLQARVDAIRKDDQKKLPLQFPKPQSSSLFKWTKDLPQVSSVSIPSSPLEVGQSDKETSLHFPEPQPSSLFKWTKDLPQVSSANIPLSSLKVSQSANDMSLTAKQPAPSKLDIDSLTSRINPLVPPTSIPSQSALLIKASQSSEIGSVISGPSPSIMERSTNLGNSSFDKSLLSSKDRTLTSKQPVLSNSGVESLPSRITQQFPPPSIPSQSTLQIQASQSSEFGGMISGPSPSIVDQATNLGNSSLDKSLLFSKDTSSQQVPPASITSQSAPQIKISQSSEIGGIIGGPSPNAVDRSVKPDNYVLDNSLISSISPEKSVTSKLPPWGTPSNAASFSGQLLSTSTSTSTSVFGMNSLSSPNQTSLSSISSFALEITPKTVNFPAVLPDSKPQIRSEIADTPIREEDEMDEEDPEVNAMLSFDRFALGQLSASSTAVNKPNPFGASAATPAAPAFSMTASTGQLFRPASFSLPASQPSQTSQPLTSGGFSGGGLSGFGRPAEIGVAQQALGSVLGSFGQSRQLGFSAQGAAIAPSSGFSSSVLTTGGFASYKPSGFATVAAGSGGFGAPSGGFASFGSSQGAGSGFSSFGGASAAANAPTSILTQMRK